MTERAARVGGQQPTLEEVAAAAGVSRGTVSRVVNNSPQVSEQAREAVRQAIDELGYVPNRAARTLVTRRTDSVALVISESEERLFEDPYFARIVRAVNVAVADTGRQLLLAMVRSGDERGRLENFLTGQHVDGVLMLSLHGSDALPYRLRGAGLPVVLGGRPLGERPIAYVDVDNRGGGRQAVAHLAERGRTRIATISGPMDMVPGMDRLAGYWEGLAAAGLAADAELVTYADFSEVGGAEAARELLDRRPDLDAIFAASDAMAFGALRVLREKGLQVPGDVAVVGFDDMPGSDRTDPPLTTIGQPVEEMGREMTRLLLALVAGEPDPDPVILTTHLTTRAST